MMVDQAFVGVAACFALAMGGLLSRNNGPCPWWVIIMNILAGSYFLGVALHH